MNDFLFWMPVVLGLIALDILEIILSNLKSPWPGRILPILFTVASVIFTLSYLIIYSVDQPMRVAIFVGCLCVPTLIFWLIYIVCRLRLKKHD